MYYVVDGATGKKIEGEQHNGPRGAKRAVLILSAHEVKNGRVANYKIEPPVDWDPVTDAVETFNLPDWVLAALKKEGL